MPGCEKDHRRDTKQGIPEVTLLTVDYFIWDELQVEDNLREIFAKGKEEKKAVPPIEAVDKETSDFIHNEVRDKPADIGTRLGFAGRTERKVAEGVGFPPVWFQGMQEIRVLLTSIIC